MSSRSESAPDVGKLARAIRAGERASLARAITLIESKRADHRKSAHQLVQDLLPQTGQALRVGITGSPGVGKSTTIDTLGTFLTERGHKVAVRWILEGHHMGYGILKHLGEPGGERLQIMGISHFHVKDGKVVGEWRVYDELALMVQVRLARMQAGA